MTDEQVADFRRLADSPDGVLIRVDHPEPNFAAMMRDKERIADLMNLVERAVQVMQSQWTAEVKEFYRRAQAVCRNLNNDTRITESEIREWVVEEWPVTADEPTILRVTPGAT